MSNTGLQKHESAHQLTVHTAINWLVHTYIFSFRLMVVSCQLPSQSRTSSPLRINVCKYLPLTPLDPAPCTPPLPHIPLLGSTDLSVTVTDPLQSCTVNPPEHLAIQGSSTRIHDIEDVILVLKLLCAITSHLTKHLRDTTGVTELTTRAGPHYHYVSNMW